MTPAQRQAALARLRKLHLLGFTRDEQHAILESDIQLKLTAMEFEDLRSEMEAQLCEMPELLDLKRDLGQTWARAEMIQNDLLGVYSGMLRNYNAHQRGQREHDDGQPVIAVRPAEIVAVGDKIIKIDQERVTSRVNALKLLQAPPPPGALPAGGPPPPAALMAGLADDEDDE